MSWQKSVVKVPEGWKMGQEILVFVDETKRRVRVPKVIGGRYTVEDVFASGGMGAVLLAHDQRVNDRPVLIKMVLMKPETEDDYFGWPGRVNDEVLGIAERDRDRLELEADFLLEFGETLGRMPVLREVVRDLSAQLYGPHAHASGDWYWEPTDDQLREVMSSELYLVMQFVRGTDLRRLADGKRQLGEVGTPRRADEVIRIGRQIGSILASFHARREEKDEEMGRFEAYFVYQDLKPENLVWNRSGVFLLDFGTVRKVALVPGDGGRLEHVFLGEPEQTKSYAAPEIRDGSAPPSEATDLFGLGATLLHLLLGEQPDPERLPEQIRALWDHDAYALGLARTVEGLMHPNPEVRLHACEPGPRANYPAEGLKNVFLALAKEVT